MLYVCVCVSQTCLCLCASSYVSFFLHMCRNHSPKRGSIFRMTGFAVRGRGHGAKWHFHHIVSPRGVPRRHRGRPWHKFTSRWLTRRGSFHDICLLEADRTLNFKDSFTVVVAVVLAVAVRQQITINTGYLELYRERTATLSQPFPAFNAVRGSLFLVAAEVVVTVTVLNQHHAMGYGLNSQSQIRC